MSKDTTIKATIDIGANINNFEGAIKEIQSKLEGLSLKPDLVNSFTKTFSEIDKEIKNIQNLTQNNQLKLIDEKKVAQSFEHLGEQYKKLISQIHSSDTKKSFLVQDQKALVALTAEVQKYSTAINKVNEKWQEEKKNKEASVASAKQRNTIAKQELSAAKKTAELNISNAKAEATAKQQSLALLKEEARLAKDRREEQAKFTEEWKKQHNDMRGANTAYETQTGNKWITEEQYLDLLNRVKDATTDLAEAKNKLSQTRIDNDASSYASYQEAANKTAEALATAQEELKKFKENAAQIDPQIFISIQQALGKIQGVDWLKDYGIDLKGIDSIEKLNEALQAVKDKGGTHAQEVLQAINEQLEKASPAAQQASRDFDDTSNHVKKLGATSSDIERLTNRLLRFFSIDNTIRLFKRAIKSAMDTVKELDKAMTETAVVTEFTVADMWKTLPEYTKRANELGLTVRDVYEASTLYYQQGLKTNEVIALTNATLRMARIAGLEAADATDRMTNALRGFNMELNDANADNIADVYSKLAAISASNVDEISTAMTKVASLANNANMSFENTAAFLSQIIETTRESAETAGTALKTVIARFSEVKENFDKGQLEFGFSEDGEEINVNKVSEALRVAGINLNEFLTGSRGLDDIFMELASKWDSLDMVQQRYIATMAAGSRQQSRFIALMSDYKRTIELTTAANDANGASQEQYEKTLDSLETKLNQLKNAWNEFLMGIANDEFIKGMVDLLTKILQGINKVTDAISGGKGLAKSIANISLMAGGLKLGHIFLQKLLGNPEAGIQGWISKLLFGVKNQSAALGAAGAQAGAKFTLGFQNSIGQKGKAAFARGISAADMGIKEIDFSKVSLSNFTAKSLDTDQFRNSLANVMTQVKVPPEYTDEWTRLTTAYRANNASLAEVQKTAQKAGVQLNMTGEQAEKAGLQYKNTAQAANFMRVGLMAAGAAMLGLSGILEKAIGKSNTFTKVLKYTGIALMAIGTVVIPMVTAAVNKGAAQATTAISSIPIIGWIAAAVTALTALTVIIIDCANATENAAREAQEQADKAKEIAEEAKQAYEDLTSSIKDLGDKYETIENLVKYTEKWRDAVHEVNQEVLGLLTKYSDLEVYRDENGVLHISEKSQQLYKQRAQAASLAAVGSARNAASLQLRNTYKKYTKEIQSSLFGGRLSSGFLKEYAQEAYLNGYTNQEIIEDLKEEALKYGMLQKSAIDLDASFETLVPLVRQFGEEIDKNNEQLQSFNQSLGASIMESLGYEGQEEQQANNFLSDKRVQEYSEKIQQLVDIAYGDSFDLAEFGKAAGAGILSGHLGVLAADIINQTAGGAHDSTAQKIGEITGNDNLIQKHMNYLLSFNTKTFKELGEEYAKLMGYETYAKLKADRGGEDVSRDTMEAALAEAKAHEIITEDTKKFVEALKKTPEEVQKFFADYGSVNI